MTITNQAQVGDIIQSPEFAYGNRDTSGNLSVGYPHEYSFLTNRAYDESRGTARFLVTSAKLGGGGRAMFNDYYSDGWEITAIRLADDDSLLGETIKFYQTGAFTPKVPEVFVVGHKTRVVSWV